MENYYAQFENCKQREEPACTNVCPFHLNVHEFQDKVSRHKYERAYKLYRNAVVFPGIVSELCPGYCRDACPRKDLDGAVDLRLLEKTCTQRAKKKEPIKYNLPRKKEKIAIIGAGPSGLACALRLIEKKYQVVVFEKENKIGGQLKSLMPEEAYLAEIRLQMGKETYQLITAAEIKNLDQLGTYGFHCIYAATGKNGTDFGTLNRKNHVYVNEKGAVVLGGGTLTGKEVIAPIADGAMAAAAIDTYFKVGTIEYKKDRKETYVIPNLEKLLRQEPVTPTDDGIFTEEEVRKEAGRCIRCQCDACETNCDLTAFLKKRPLAMKEEIAATTIAAESMLHKAPAIRMINTCTQCGLYEESCPAHIEFKDMILEARKLIHKQGKMPPAFHGFWLDDMMHANSQRAKICKHAPRTMRSDYVFFPGCNLGAADPNYVEQSYKWLIDHFKNIGLLLRCCSIHASWSGDEVLHNEQIAEMRQDWESLGKPILITACPSCTRHMREYLPELKTVSIYEFMADKQKWPQTSLREELTDCSFAIFDPCSSRYDVNLQTSIRDLLRELSINAGEIAGKGNYGCCGYGGDTAVANPDFANYVTKERAKLDNRPYITYCSNCRDAFMDDNKQSVHLFDLLFDVNGFDYETCDYTQRRKNRIKLKETLLADIWGESTANNEMNQYSIEIVLSGEVRQKMKRLRLVEDDVKTVLEKSNQAHRKVYDKEHDEFVCYAKLNYITCWVRYKMEDDKYLIQSVYTHRMDLKLEEVWNGRKVNPDL